MRVEKFVVSENKQKCISRKYVYKYAYKISGFLFNQLDCADRQTHKQTHREEVKLKHPFLAPKLKSGNTAKFWKANVWFGIRGPKLGKKHSSLSMSSLVDNDYLYKVIWQSKFI